MLKKLSKLKICRRETRNPELHKTYTERSFIALNRCTKLTILVVAFALTSSCIKYQSVRGSDLIPLTSQHKRTPANVQNDNIKALEKNLSRGGSKQLSFRIRTRNRNLSSKIINYLNMLPGSLIFERGRANFEIDVRHKYIRVKNFKRSRLYSISTTVKIIENSRELRGTIIRAISQSSMQCQKTNTIYANPPHCKEAESITLSEALANLKPT